MTSFCNHNKGVGYSKKVSSKQVSLGEGLSGLGLLEGWISGFSRIGQGWENQVFLPVDFSESLLFGFGGAMFFSTIDRVSIINR